MKIIGLGNALVDILIRIPNDEFLAAYALPKGSMQLSQLALTDRILDDAAELEKHFNSGGSAANTIHGLAKLGAETGYIGKVGNDEHGIFFKDDLENNHIISFLTKGSQGTGKAMALISPDSERTFATYLGSAIELTTDDIKAKQLAAFDVLHIEGYLVQNQELIEEALRIAKENNLKTSIDLASYNVVEDNRNFLLKLIKNYVDIVFANEEEAKALTLKEPRKALDEIATMSDIAVVKLGSKGSLIKQGDKVYTVDVIKVNPLDTTGAGDLYAAGFLYGLSKGKSLHTCGNYGAILAGKVIEHIGAKIPDEVWAEVKKLMKKT
ncbi:MAG: adenosine kinase [Bacteroidota bacterium]